MKVTWSDRALKSLAAIHEWISESSQQRAHDVVDRLLERGDCLASFPEMGRKVAHFSLPEIRELVVKPYRVLYRIEIEEIQIIDVFHGAQQPPWERADED
jgi:addiction module RelE/StbE family toxin